MTEVLSNAEIKRIGVSFVESMKVVRVKTLIRLLQHYSSYKTDNAWGTFVSRMIQSSELVYLQRGGKQVGSIVGISDVKLRPMLEVQHAHELRVAEVAVEFIRQGFEWTPPINNGVGASKVADGTAWMDDVRIDVEVELSPKNQRRWGAVIDRYRKKQETQTLGVVYVFGNDGIRRSFRTIMAENNTPGWWYLGLNDGQSLQERQEADAVIAQATKQAVMAGEIQATNPDTRPTNTEIQPANNVEGETAPTPARSAEQPPERAETELERMRRELLERRRQKQQETRN